MIRLAIRILLVCGVTSGFLFIALRLSYYGKDWCEATLPLEACKPLFGAVLGGIIFVAAFFLMTELKKAFKFRSHTKQSPRKAE